MILRPGGRTDYNIPSGWKLSPGSAAGTDIGRGGYNEEVKTTMLCSYVEGEMCVSRCRDKSEDGAELAMYACKRVCGSKHRELGHAASSRLGRCETMMHHGEIKVAAGSV